MVGIVVVKRRLLESYTESDDRLNMEDDGWYSARQVDDRYMGVDGSLWPALEDECDGPGLELIENFARFADLDRVAEYLNGVNKVDRCDCLIVSPVGYVVPHPIRQRAEYCGFDYSLRITEYTEDAYSAIYNSLCFGPPNELRPFRRRLNSNLLFSSFEDVMAFGEAFENVKSEGTADVENCDDEFTPFLAYSIYRFNGSVSGRDCI